MASEMARAFPYATVLCLWGDEPFGNIASQRRWESWLSATPLRRHKAVALPFMIPTWRHLPGVYDWLLVSSHLFAHHARLRDAPDVPKLVYAHTPARYIWDPELDERGRSLPARLASRFLKPLDRRRAGEALSVAANSGFVRDRVASAWGRDARVIYPPVDTEQIRSVANWHDRLDSDEQEAVSGIPDEFILGASRFVPYKRLDLVIRAGELVDVPVVIAGAGPQEAQLRELASEVSVPVHFVINPSNALLYSLYQRAMALIFPPVEDFGIIPVEAMSVGTPIIVNEVGGARESLEAVGGVGGAVWDLQPSSFQAALAAATSRTISAPAVAARFSRARFRQELRDWVAAEVGASGG